MARKDHKYYVYILTNRKNGTLYIGMTNNVERRVHEHKNAMNDGFTKRYKLKKLVYYEFHQYAEDAIKREKQLKNWRRQWKIDLIEKENPDWMDIAEKWYE